MPLDLAAYPELAATLKSFVLDLVEYRLHARRPPIPADIVRKRAEAADWLRKVASGEVSLPSEKAVAENEALGEIGRATGAERVLTRDSLEDL